MWTFRGLGYPGTSTVVSQPSDRILLTALSFWLTWYHLTSFISSLFHAAVNYLGCFSSPSDMTLNSNFAAAELTPESCVTVCGKTSMKYAGITSGNQCYCSNTVPDVSNETGDTACYYPCEGDKALKCGSNLYFSVYEAPGEFNFPFALSVPDASEAFKSVQIAMEPAYDGAEMIINFGDGTVINTKNSSYDYMFTSLGTHEVLAFVFCSPRLERF